MRRGRARVVTVRKKMTQVHLCEVFPFLIDIMFAANGKRFQLSHSKVPIKSVGLSESAAGMLGLNTQSTTAKLTLYH